MLTKLNLSDQEIHRLNEERYHYPDYMIQKRLHAVYIKATQTGKSNSKIGELLSLHRNTISSYLNIYKIYKTSGIEGLYKKNYHPQSGALESYADSIIPSLKESPVCTMNETINRIKELTGIQRQPSAVRNFLHKHDFSHRKMASIPGKADPDKQREWVQKTLNSYFEKAKDGKIHLLFSDAAHFTLSSFVCKVWCVSRIFLKTSHGRNRINVLGAINAITKDVTTLISNTYIHAETIIEFLQQLKQKYSDKPIVIVLDNAKYQHCQAVKDMAAMLNIDLLFLPHYSPNLNIFERLWKYTKKKVIYAKYFSNAKEFHNAIETFFKEINEKHMEDLNKLMTLNFQIFEKDDIAQKYSA